MILCQDFYNLDRNKFHKYIGNLDASYNQIKLGKCVRFRQFLMTGQDDYFVYDESRFTGRIEISDHRNGNGINNCRKRSE